MLGDGASNSAVEPVVVAVVRVPAAGGLPVVPLASSCGKEDGSCESRGDSDTGALLSVTVVVVVVGGGLRAKGARFPLQYPQVDQADPHNRIRFVYCCCSGGGTITTVVAVLLLLVGGRRGTSFLLLLLLLFCDIFADCVLGALRGGDNGRSTKKSGPIR